MPTFEAVAESATKIEAEMRRAGLWQLSPLPPHAFDSNVAFCGDTMTCEQWIQFVLLPRVREIVADRGQLPQDSQVAAYAIRNLDVSGSDALLECLAEFDGLFTNRG